MANSPEVPNGKKFEINPDFDLKQEHPEEQVFDTDSLNLRDVPPLSEREGETAIDLTLDLDNLHKSDDLSVTPNVVSTPSVESVKQEAFQLPKGLVDYVNDLILKSDPEREELSGREKYGRTLSPRGQKLAMLVFDLKFVNSESKLQEVISDFLKKGVLSENEYEEMMSICGPSSQEALNEKHWQERSQAWLKDWNEQKKKVGSVKKEPELGSNVDSRGEDAEFQQLAIDAYQNPDGDFYEIQRNLMKIKNPDFQSSAIGEIVDSLIKDKKFDRAETLTNLIKDDDYRERLFTHIKNERAKPELVEGIESTSVAASTTEVPIETLEVKVEKTKDGEIQATSQTVEKKEAPINGIVNTKVFSAMDRIVKKIRPSEKEIFRELRKELSSTKDYAVAEAILMDPKYAISIPGPDRKLIMSYFDKSSAKQTPTPSQETPKTVVQPEVEVSPIVSKLPINVTNKDVNVVDAQLNLQEPIIKSESVENDLDLARLNYVQSKLNYEKKTREHLSKFQKVMSSLGLSKSKEDLMKINPPSISEEKKQYDEALSQYINAKKLDRERIISTPITSEEAKEFGFNGVLNNFEAVEGAIITWRLMDYADKEAEYMQNEEQKLIQEGQSEKVKKIKELAVKGLAIWNIVTPKQRLAARSLLIGAAAGLTGGLSAAVMTGGGVLLKGGAGIIGALGAGEIIDAKFDKTNQKNQMQREGQFLDENISFEERELADMKKREEELKIKKAQKVKKAMAQFVVGAGSGVMAGLAENALSHSFNSGAGHGGGPRVSQVGTQTPEVSQNLSMPNDLKDSHFNPMVPQSSAELLPSDGGPELQPDQVEYQTEMGEGSSDLGETPEVKTVVEQASASIEANTEATEILPISVESSPKGFLQDIIDLKQKLRVSPYEISEEMKKNLMDKTPMEIAKEYGMYDQESDMSGMSMNGAHLGVDSKGHLVYEYQGEAKTMYDYETGKIKSFEEIDGKMFKPEVVENTVTEASDTTTPVTAEAVDSQSAIAIPDDQPIIQVNESEPNWVGQNQDSHISLNNDESVDIQNVADNRTVLFNEGNSRISIGHEEIVDGKKILVIDDRFKEGVINGKYREAFNLAFVKNVEIDEKAVVDGMDFNDGKIYAIRGFAGNQSKINVFLDGKEIARGTIENGIPKVKIIPEVKGGFWEPDNVYERALKALKKTKIIEELVSKKQ